MKKIKTKIRGISHYQENIPYLMEGKELTLVREPENKFDKNAIKVMDEIRMLGYIAKKTNKGSELNKELAEIMDAGTTVLCRVIGKTGAFNELRGVNIEVTYEKNYM